MALNEKLGKLVDVILSRKVVAVAKIAEGEQGGGGGSPAMSVSVEDQGEIVELERKPGDFDKKEEKFHDKIKDDLKDIKDKANADKTTDKTAGDSSPVSDSGDAAFDYLVTLMTNDTGMTVDRAINETKKVFYTDTGSPTDVATALASLEGDILGEETFAMISKMEHAGVSIKPGPSKYIARVYSAFLAGKVDLSDVKFEPNDFS